LLGWVAGAVQASHLPLAPGLVYARLPERGPIISPVDNLFDAFIAPQWPRSW